MNRYLVDIKNHPDNTDLEHNYEEDTEPLCMKNLVLLGETGEGKICYIAQNISIEELKEIIISLRRINFDTYCLLKSAMLLADAELQVLDLNERRGIASMKEFLNAPAEEVRK